MRKKVLPRQKYDSDFQQRTILAMAPVMVDLQKTTEQLLILFGALAAAAGVPVVPD